MLCESFCLKYKNAVRKETETINIFILKIELQENEEKFYGAQFF